LSSVEHKKIYTSGAKVQGRQLFASAINGTAPRIVKSGAASHRKSMAISHRVEKRSVNETH